MQLYFVRHGETDWNRAGRMQGMSDIPLNEHGLAQARSIAARLVAEAVPFEAIYSSPLQRAAVTAKAIGNSVGLIPVSDRRLIENGVGPLEGLTFEDIKLHFPQVYQAWRSGLARPRFEGEETPEELGQRLNSFLDELKARHPKENVIVVSHGGTLNSYFQILVGYSLDRRSPFSFDNGSLSIVDFGWTWPRVRLLNDTCHLRGDAPETPSQPVLQELKTPAADADKEQGPEAKQMAREAR